MNRTVLFKRLFSTKLTNVKDVKPLLKSQLNTGIHSNIADRAFIKQWVETITNNNRSLPPPVLTQQCCDYYKRLDQSGKMIFLKTLANEFGVNREDATQKVYAYIKSAESEHSEQLEKELREELEPKYNRFFDRIQQLPNGLKILTDMRADLLSMMMVKQPNDVSNMEQDIRLKLKKYLIGFLKFGRVTWENSSGELLEKICAYEAVHAVQHWQDIKRRLGRDRRVYAFFLKDAPNEPLVFVHVALVPSMSNSIQAILDATDVNSESQFKCATCYSITTQQGLGGINLGNYLIKRVVQDLRLQFPQLETFCTLSPIPRFKRWLLEHLKEEDIQRQFKHEVGEDWYMKLDRFNQQDQIELKNTLMSMCARYILIEKRNGKYATDPVANFHLRNGACAHQIHWMADTSEKGLNESFSIMINYNYITEHIELNNQLYLKDGTICVSEPANGWLSNWIGDDNKRIE